MATRNEIEEAIRDGRKMHLYGSPASIKLTAIEHVMNNLWRVTTPAGTGMEAGANIIIEPRPKPPVDATKRFVRALTPR